MHTKATHLANLLQSCIDIKSHLAGKLLHAHILRNGLLSDTFLCNRLIEFYSKCGHIDSAHKVFNKISRKDIYSWNAILNCYCKVGNLEQAHILFNEMPERNTVSWNTLISSSIQNGFDERGLKFYYRMHLEGFIPTRYTLASVFSACGVLMDFDHGSKCHALAIKIGLDKNMYVGNSLLCMYTKCKSIGHATQVFGELSEPNEVSFTALIGGLSQIDQVDALQIFRLMHRQGIRIDSVTLSSILGVCTKSQTGESSIFYEDYGVFTCRHGKLVHGFTIKLGYENDLHLSNSLLDMYAKNGNMDSAEIIFTNLPTISVVSWNVMIAGYGQKCEMEKSVDYFQRMKLSGFEPDDVTFINMLSSCVKHGYIEEGRKMFTSISCPSLSSWNAMLSGYTQNGNHHEALSLFRDMQFGKFKFDRSTLAIILSSCANMGLLEGGKQVHATSLKNCCNSDKYVASGLIGFYSKCKKVETSKIIFDRVPEMDIVCWNSMISGFLLNSLDGEVFIFFKKMRENGMSPTHFSYAIVLNCCAKLASSDQGRQIHAQIVGCGYINDVFVGSSLIHMYSKCGVVDGARQCFDTMPNKNIVIWNEMVHGYAQNGRGEEALWLYRKMIELGMKPDSITFIAILTACSHSGLVDEGIEIFNSMKEEAFLDHYTCIIDSLSRAGRFKEAEAILDKMPYKDDPIVWEVLLSACRVHSNVSLGRRAAEELIRLDPHNSTPYLLLANTYTSFGRWDDVRALRERMSDNQVRKDPASSWIEYRNQMQVFMVDDGLDVVDHHKSRSSYK